MIFRCTVGKAIESGAAGGIMAFQPSNGCLAVNFNIWNLGKAQKYIISYYSISL